MASGGVNMPSTQFIGTSHISKESIDKVREKILSEKPDIVAIELDEGRLRALLAGKKKIPLSAIRQLGLFGFLFQVVGSHFQRELGRQVKQTPGIDMKTAYLAAKKVNAKIFLIDQPIQTTLQKISKVPLFEKIKFFFSILFGVFSKEKIELDLTKVPAEDMILKLARDFKDEFPNFYGVLVTERDKYISNQILHVGKHFPDKNILVVLGAGHLKGVRRLLIKNQ